MSEPQTEADAPGLLFQFLAAVGNLFGKKGYLVVDRSTIFLNPFLMVVSATSPGRKGTALGHVMEMLAALDPDWSEDHVVECVSGEGLINLARHLDPRDRRLLVLLPEARGLLQRCQVRDSTLAEVLGNAADGRTLDSLTRNRLMRATAAHVSLIGHMTLDELKAVADPVALSANPYNRFLWILTRRSKCLPLGGSRDWECFESFSEKLDKVIEVARAFKRLHLDDSAVVRYKAVYDTLGVALPGAGAGLLTRGPEHVLRLALLFAVLDASQVVTDEHMSAGIAAWQFCRESAGVIGSHLDCASLPRLACRQQGQEAE